MLFENQQIDSNELPRVEDLKFVPLESRYLKVSVITTILFWLVIGIGATILYIYKSHEFPSAIKFIIPIALFTVFLASLLMVIKGFHMKSYALRQRDIIYKTGLIWQKQTSLPFNRVQHCEVNRGPIERMFNLSSLHVFTAGGSSSDLSIPGLSPEAANELKEFIVKKIKSDEEE